MRNNIVKIDDEVLKDINYRICQTQGELYEYMAIHDYDLEDFSKKYLQSNFAKRQMDCLYSRYQLREPEEILDFLLPEIGEIKMQKSQSGAIAYWMGFVYRGLCFATGLSSKDIENKIPFQNLKKLYLGYHVMDEIMQLEKIIELYF